MNQKELEAFAKKAAKSLRSEKDLSHFSQTFKKVMLEAALAAELDDHLGYEKHQSSNHSNSRNGHSNKRLSTDDGTLDIEVPRDRDSSFEPQLIKKQQTRFTGMDDKILFLYAQGMSTRDICTTFKEMYDVDVSPTLISRVTNAVMERVVEWQLRPLDPVYTIVTWSSFLEQPS